MLRILISFHFILLLHHHLLHLHSLQNHTHRNHHQLSPIFHRLLLFRFFRRFQERLGVFVILHRLQLDGRIRLRRRSHRIRCGRGFDCTISYVTQISKAISYYLHYNITNSNHHTSKSIHRIFHYPFRPSTFYFYYQVHRWAFLLLHRFELCNLLSYV